MCGDQFNEERSVQALSSARAEILHLSKAAADIEERFGKYRAENVSILHTAATFAFCTLQCKR